MKRQKLLNKRLLKAKYSFWPKWKSPASAGLFLAFRPKKKAAR
jgi:hypothetical protein